MSRSRVIYQSEGLFVSSGISATGTGAHLQLKRVQSANYSFEIARQDVNQFGQLARIDALVLQSPTVSLDLSYYLADGFNERALGFAVQNGGANANVNFASGQMVSSEGRNFYIVTSAEGIDLNFDTGTGPAATNGLSGKGVIGIGNGFITDYTLNAAVGDLPTVSLSVEGLGFNAATYSSSANVTGVPSPAINPASGTSVGLTVQLPPPGTGDGVTALRPGDITLNFGTFTGTGGTPTSNLDMTGANSINIQSVSLSLPMSRTPIERLGSRFAFARVTDFPVTATMSVNALVNEVQARNLATMIDDGTERDITLTIKKPGLTEEAVRYVFKAARLDSESYSSDIGSNKSVDITFSTQIGGPNDSVHGIFVSGADNSTLFV
jgi:hypothetical protein